jgi:hypothetical protein
MIHGKEDYGTVRYYAARRQITRVGKCRNQNLLGWETFSDFLHKTSCGQYLSHRSGVDPHWPKTFDGAPHLATIEPKSFAQSHAVSLPQQVQHRQKKQTAQ